jgi:hypothetical protein
MCAHVLSPWAVLKQKKIGPIPEEVWLLQINHAEADDERKRESEERF